MTVDVEEKLATRIRADNAKQTDDSQVFFIVGVARSGTSFMHRILNLHQEVRMSYEGQLFTDGWECYREDAPYQTQAAFNKLLDRLCACDAPQPRNHWLADSINQHRDALWARYQKAGSFPELLEEIYQLTGHVQCWGNKILRSEHCERILENFPDARFAVLLRDPRAVYASQKRYFTGMRLRYSAMYSNQHLLWAHEVAQHDSRFYLVRYEHFVREPREALQSIFGLMNVENEAAVERILESDPPHAESLEKWREHLSEKEIGEIEALCFERMQIMGYQPEIAIAQKSMNRVMRAFELFFEFLRIFPINPKVWRRKRLWHRFLKTLRD